jgi:hypothetical protein
MSPAADDRPVAVVIPFPVPLREPNWELIDAAIAEMERRADLRVVRDLGGRNQMCAHDIEAAARPQDANGHAPAARQAASTGWTPPPRHLSYITGEHSVELDYAGLSTLMDEVFAVWDAVETGRPASEIGDLFEVAIMHIGRLRDFTGCDGGQVVR